jgi:hypothetical protein
VELLALLAVSVVFLMSLLGALVLFKVLKSSALIKRPGYQAGGALAGFLLIYGALYYSFDRTVQNWMRSRAEWTITGMVLKDGVAIHDGIRVSQTPPEPSNYTETGGTFRLENVVSGDAMPEIRFESQGYFPGYLTIDAQNATVDDESNRREAVSGGGAERSVNHRRDHGGGGSGQAQPPWQGRAPDDNQDDTAPGCDGGGPLARDQEGGGEVLHG